MDVVHACRQFGTLAARAEQTGKAHSVLNGETPFRRPQLAIPFVGLRSDVRRQARTHSLNAKRKDRRYYPHSYICWESRKRPQGFRPRRPHRHHHPVLGDVKYVYAIAAILTEPAQAGRKTAHHGRYVWKERSAAYAPRIKPLHAMNGTPAGLQPVRDSLPGLAPYSGRYSPDSGACFHITIRPP